MKKFLALLIVMMFMGMNVHAASLASAISKYKDGNYTGCMNELQEYANSIANNKDDVNAMKQVMQILSKYNYEKWISIKNPTLEDEMEAAQFLDEVQKYVPKSSLDKFSYLFYYCALSLHQLGYTSEAKSYYGAAAAFSWGSRSKIYTYSMQARDCIEKPNSCQNSDMDEFIRSGKQVSDTIIKDELRKNLEKQKEEINKGNGLSYNEEDNQKLAWGDAGIPTELNNVVNEDVKQENAVPTDEEIGRAVRTLQRAGINPAGYMNNPVNNEYAQLNYLLNDGNNNYQNDYATMMMMNNGSGKISPELMQTIMRQQMMGGYGF